MLIEKLFEEVLRLSFYGSIGCGVILICVLVNYTRTPRWISMVLWGLVALRLVVPLSVYKPSPAWQYWVSEPA